jgi:hypothetical protein
MSMAPAADFCIELVRVWVLLEEEDVVWWLFCCVDIVVDDDGN